MYVSPVGWGKVSVNGGAPLILNPFYKQYPVNESITVSAHAESGRQFHHWVIVGSGSQTFYTSSVTFNLDVSKTVTAYFVNAPAPPAPASIGNMAWEDLNINGLQDEGEPGLSDVTVNLYDAAGNLSATRTTGADGIYSFTSLDAGNYQVVFTAPVGYSFSPRDQGPDDEKDSDADMWGATCIINLAAGMEYNSVDAGMYPSSHFRLESGWNLFSLPYYIEPEDRNVNSLLDGIIEDLNVVWGYKACGRTWANFSTTGPEGNLGEMRDGPGYWVNLNNEHTLLINGCVLPSLPQLPPSYPVCIGWNLLGFKSSVPQTASEYLKDINYSVIYGFENGGYKSVKAGDYLFPGYGYWVAVLQPGTLYPFGQIMKDVSIIEASSMVEYNAENPEFLILDVRTSGEYASGHLENAINLDYLSEEFEDGLSGLDKDKAYLVYCKAGIRSASALAMMEEMEFRQGYNMLGGIDAWQAQGLPVVLN